MILKVCCKILVSFGLVQNLELSDLALAKVEMSISQLPNLLICLLIVLDNILVDKIGSTQSSTEIPKVVWAEFSTLS
jgi:hypothetical protein